MRYVSACFSIFAALAGCGGDATEPGQGSSPGQSEPGVVCAAPRACGGDVTGTWTLDRVCLSPLSNILPGCAASTYDGVIDNASGQWTFSADGQYTRDYSYMGSQTLQVPTSCLPAGSDCASLATGGRTCSTAATGCQCDKIIDVTEGQMAQVTLFKSAGTVLDITGVGMFDYCVQGSQLHLALRPNQSSAANGPEPQRIFRLTKQ